VIRYWRLKFSPKIVVNLRPRLDEVVSTTAGEYVCIWRAVDDDDEGEVMGMIVQKRCDTGAAVRVLRWLLKNLHLEPQGIFTDGLRSYGAALSRLGLIDRHQP
jgi:putative transposase